MTAPLAAAVLLLFTLMGPVRADPIPPYGLRFEPGPASGSVGDVLLLTVGPLRYEHSQRWILGGSFDPRYLRATAITSGHYDNQRGYFYHLGSSGESTGIYFLLLAPTGGTPTRVGVAAIPLVERMTGLDTISAYISIDSARYDTAGVEMLPEPPYYLAIGGIGAALLLLRRSFS